MDMNAFVWTVRVRTDGRANSVHARNHAFSIGDPVSYRPTDAVVSALETALGAFAADLAGTFRTLATRRRIFLDALEVAATCRLRNPLVYVGVVGEEGDPGIEAIEATLYVAADAANDEIQSIFEETLQRSPLVNTFQKAATVTVRLCITA